MPLKSPTRRISHLVLNVYPNQSFLQEEDIFQDMVQREENNLISVYDFHQNWLDSNLQGLGTGAICNIQQTNGPLVGKFFIDPLS
jgi:hypothetical protein